jgi:hypothetical protein
VHHFVGELGAQKVEKVLHVRATDYSGGTLGRDAVGDPRQAVACQAESSAHRAGDIQSEVESGGEQVGDERSIDPQCALYGPQDAS